MYLFNIILMTNVISCSVDLNTIPGISIMRSFFIYDKSNLLAKYVKK